MKPKFIFEDNPEYIRLTGDDNTVVTENVTADYQFPMRYADGGVIGGKPAPLPSNINSDFANRYFNENANLNFVDRWRYPNKYPGITRADGRTSSHMMFDSDNKIAPMIVQLPDGNLKEFTDWRKALDYANRTGEYIEFDHPEHAKRMAKNGYKQAIQYK